MNQIIGYLMGGISGWIVTIGLLVQAVLAVLALFAGKSKPRFRGWLSAFAFAVGIFAVIAIVLGLLGITWLN